MKNRRIDIDAYLAGKIELPELFTTGFRRDMHLAREIIRRRRAMQSNIRIGKAT